jgi:hypothetical protein
MYLEFRNVWSKHMLLGMLVYSYCLKAWKNNEISQGKEPQDLDFRQNCDFRNRACEAVKS